MAASHPSRCLVVAGVLLALGGALVLPSAAHAEESVEVEFSISQLGEDRPSTADGWATWTHPAGRYDWALVDTADFPAAGLDAGVALRFSNAVYRDAEFTAVNQLTSPGIEAAGEPVTGAVNNTFEATFTVASATGALQTPLAISVSLDNGSGSRSGGTLTLIHSAAGLQIASSAANPGSAAAAADWTTTYSAFYPADQPHRIRAVTRYVTDGPDVLEIFVDDALALTGWTYEAYHEAAGSTHAQQQTSALLFRASRQLASTPGTEQGTGTFQSPDPTETARLLGEGFLVTDLAYRSFNTIPAEPPSIPPAPPAPSGAVDLEVDEATPRADTPVTIEATGMLPGELVGFTAYSSPIFLGYAVADGSGRAALTFRPQAVGLPAGAHTVVATGVTSSRIATNALTVHALAATGVEAEEGIPVLIGGAALLAGGIALAVLGATRPWRRRMHARR